jgi:hypothetical protein
MVALLSATLSFSGWGRYFELVALHHGHLGKQRTAGLPAFGAAAGMVMRSLRAEGHLDLVGGAVPVQRSAGKTGDSWPDAGVNPRMNGNGMGHGLSLFRRWEVRGLHGMVPCNLGA